MDKDIPINRETLIKLEIDPQDAIEYLESKKAKDINPIHVHALQTLKKRPAVASS